MDRTLADYLPSVAGRIENADQITLRMMVQHRSGIPNYSDDPNYQWFESLDDLDSAVELIYDKLSEIDPDELTSGYMTDYCCDLKLVDYVGLPAP